jgi:DNA-binding transcriptional ArsR family regulator
VRWTGSGDRAQRRRSTTGGTRYTWLYDQPTVFIIGYTVKVSDLIPDSFLDLMAEKVRMFADPTRLAILRTPMQGERNVTQVVEGTGRNQANVSKLLKMLAEAGLLVRHIEGLQLSYKLDDSLVERLCKLVCEAIVRQAVMEIDRQQEPLDRWDPKRQPTADR